MLYFKFFLINISNNYIKNIKWVFSARAGLFISISVKYCHFKIIPITKL